MKYTYHISTNGSDYTEVFPVNSVTITGVWENDSWIDRVECSEIKIHKKGNETIYNTIAAWIIDPTKYSTECFFKIKKLGVDWKTFVFGVRWGKIDLETGVYKFKPQSYDSFYRYWGPYIERDITDFSAVYGNWIPGTNFEMHYVVYDYTSLGKPYVTTLSPVFSINWQVYKIWDLYTTIVNNASLGITLKSTLFNNDASTIITAATDAGVVMDYVTGSENVFINAGIKASDLFKYTIKQLFELLEVFQIGYFFENNTTLRVEHVKYFLTQIQNNAVSITFDSDEREYEYLDPSVPYKEDFSLNEESTNLDEDFHKQVIKYSLARTGFSGVTISNSYSQFTDIEKYISDTTDHEDLELIIASPYQHICELTKGGISVNDNYPNDFAYVELAAIPTPVYLLSNDIKLDDTTEVSEFSCVVEMTNIPRTTKACLRKRSTNAIISNEVTLSLGTNTFTLTSNGGSENDAVFSIYFTPVRFDSFIGWATVQTVYNASVVKPYRLASELGAVTGIYKNNGPFSQANIIENWWQMYRPTNTGIVNGVAKSFTNSQFIIKRECKKRYWPNDVNMKYGINDGSKIAKIDSYTRDLDTDFVQFNLLYQE